MTKKKKKENLRLFMDKGGRFNWLCEAIGCFTADAPLDPCQQCLHGTPFPVQLGTVETLLVGIEPCVVLKQAMALNSSYQSDPLLSINRPKNGRGSGLRPDMQ